MIRRFLPALALALASAGAQGGELADLVNGLREAGSKCAAPQGLPAFVPRRALDRAAAAIAAGAPLADSLKAAGYRMASAQVISLSGTTEDAKLETLIAGRFCAVITDAKLVDIGVFQRGSGTWILMAAPFAPGVAISAVEVPRRLLSLVNDARSEPRRCGNRDFAVAKPVQWNDVLTKAARAHSEDMAGQNYFSHDGRDGSQPHGRVARTGYKYRAMGENIAAGQMTPEGVMAGWIASPPHCANLMNPVFTEMGVAFATNAKSGMGVYWTQVFGAPLN